MRLRIFKKGTRELTSGVETYMVRWEATSRSFRTSTFSDIYVRYQGFTDEQEAKDFAKSLRRANALVGHSGLNVSLEKMSNGLSE